ncbi:MAG: hypothetical protein V3S09_04680 [Candidatus Bathyarchaeia archaeon]
MTEALRFEADDELRRAELMSLANKISDEEDPALIERLATFLQQGIMGPREAREILERTLQPRIITLPGATQEGRRDAIRRLYAEGHTMQQIIDRMAEDGYDADSLIHGRPRTTFRAEAAEDLKVGELVMMDGNGNARRARPDEQVVGVHLGNGEIQFTGGLAVEGIEMSYAIDGRNYGNYGSMLMHASIAYGGPRNWHKQDREPPGQRVDGPAFKYTERFAPEVEAKAMELLRKFMSPEQYEAFVDRADIELENKAATHRVIINQNGSFKLLKGGHGAGIVMTSGNVRSYRYPLGDEIAAFLDWFRYRTDDLIAGWNCGNFGIVRDRLGENPPLEEAVRGVGFLGAAMAQVTEATRGMAEAIERIFDERR